MKSNNIIKRILKLYLPLSIFFILAAANPSSALVINASFVDNTDLKERWSTERMDVINQAISDWETAIISPQEIDITFDFTNAGNSYLGQWDGRFSYSYGDTILPWSESVDHTIHFNSSFFNTDTSLWFDPSPHGDTDLTLAYWDVLSVARHELGHALGFVDSLYGTYNSVDNIHYLWDSLITGNIFDAGGLNVPLSSDLSHTADSGSTSGDLMNTRLTNGQRRNISQTDLGMLSLAYGYELAAVPIPGTCFLLFSGIALMALGRRRQN